MRRLIPIVLASLLWHCGSGSSRSGFLSESNVCRTHPEEQVLVAEATWPTPTDLETTSVGIGVPLFAQKIPSSDKTREVSAIVLWKAAAGASKGLTVEIYGDSAGKPNSSQLAKASFSASLIESLTGEWDTLEFDSVFKLESGKAYWIVFNPREAATATNFWVGTISGEGLLRNTQDPVSWQTATGYQVPYRLVECES